MEFNEFQTPITKELLETIPNEVQEQLLDFVHNVPFIRNLVSIKRERAKDRPRDEQGRIIVDLANPHILEDMDYFRPTAIHFQEHGCFTLLKPNSNPNSGFMKWIKEEKRRCWEGYVRESDGEWVPGYFYFFLNYSPIMLSKIIEGTNRADRVRDFPEVWEGIYWRFHYIEQASKGGLYNKFLGGQHGAELASRGKGKSFSLASILSHDFILGVNERAHKEVLSLVTAYQKEYLTKDGVINKFISMIDFCAEHTQFPRRRLKESLQEMTWIMGYKDAELGINKGTLNSIIGVSSKDDESKLRGKRAAHILVEEFGCHIKGTKVLMYDGTFKNVEDVRIGDILMGDDNTPRIVEKLYNGVDELYKITLSNGDYQIVNSHHPVYFKKYNWNKKEYTEHTLTAPELLKIKHLDKGYYIPKASIKFPHKPVPINPYFLGLWLGDGDSTRLDVANEDEEVLNWLSDNYDGYIRDLKQSDTCKVFHISKKTHVYNRLFSDLNLFNNKHIPIDYKINSSEIQLQVIAGLIDSDGTYNKKKNFFEITQIYHRKHILDDIKFMCESNGLKCSLTTRVSTGKKPGVLHYRLRISGNVSIIPTKIPRKKGINNTSYRTKNNWSDYTFKVEPYGTGEYYGFTIDKNHLFVLGDLTITHNSFPKLTDIYNVIIPSVQEGDIAFGMIYMLGTAGDDDSDFMGAQEIMYQPIGYNMYALPNNYDKEGHGKPNFVFFFPGYINRKGCYNKDGVSDVIKALIEILMNRYRVKYNSTDPMTIVKTIAEIPIVPQEAIQRTKNNIFPVTDINNRISEIDANPNFYDDIYVGTLVFGKSGEVEFKVTDSKPIRDFPTKDNKCDGALEIYEMPVKVHGKIPTGRYIASLDNYENDTSNTMSLGSMFVLDLWTDRIVAEYTGRPQFVDDLNELARKLCIFYNAQMLYESNKKSTFAYFSKMNSLHWLADTPEYLKNKQIVKTVGYGNTSKGVNATTPVKDYGYTLIRDWLLKPVTTIQHSEEGDIEITLPNLYFIKNRALLKEFVSFNPEINVDRIMSMVQLMLYREEKMILYQGEPSKGKEAPSGYLGKDSFFEKNYKKKAKGSI